MSKKLFLFSLVFFAASNMHAQQKKIDYRKRTSDSVVIINTQEKAERIKMPPALRKEMDLGLRLNTDGWNVYFNYGLIRNNEGAKHEIDRFYDVLVFQLEIGEKVHPKEYRSMAYDPSGNSSGGILTMFSKNSFVYGKINTFYQAKMGVGYKKLIAGKPEQKTVSIHWQTIGGFAGALLKPYYYETTAGELTLKPDDAADALRKNTFTGGYGIQKGWDTLKFVPGVHLKSGLVFDFAKKRKRLGAVEIGGNLEYYFKPIHQMALQKPKSFFFNAYVALQFGWKR